MRSEVMLGALLVLGAPAWADESKPEKGEGFAVRFVDDVAYYTGEGADKERHKLDLYLPSGARDYPVLLFIHGGGWRAGSKAPYARHGLTFARKGIGFVAINYRLTPAKWPAHIEDVARAFAWTHKNIGKYGGRADRIFVSGHSAGGHLAALLASDESHLKAHKLGLKDVRGVIPVSGVFTIGGRLGKIFGDEDACKKASPITHVKANLPPMLVLYADAEIGRLGDDAERFVKALKKAKCEATVAKIEDRNHGTIVSNIARADDPATKLIFAFIEKHAGAKAEVKEAKKE
jgi:acetyl esterase/lipase